MCHMSTLAGRQTNVMMRLKFHFQIIQNFAQVTNSYYSYLSQNCNTEKFPKKTCTHTIKTIHKHCLKYLQKLRIICERKVN